LTGRLRRGQTLCSVFARGIALSKNVATSKCRDFRTFCRREPIFWYPAARASDGAPPIFARHDFPGHATGSGECRAWCVHEGASTSCLSFCATRSTCDCGFGEAGRFRAVSQIGVVKRRRVLLVVVTHHRLARQIVLVHGHRVPGLLAGPVRRRVRRAGRRRIRRVPMGMTTGKPLIDPGQVATMRV